MAVPSCSAQLISGDVAGRNVNRVAIVDIRPDEESCEMAQKGAGGNAGAITEKGGDGAHGSGGTGRGGGNSGSGSTGARTKKEGEDQDGSAADRAK